MAQQGNARVLVTGGTGFVGSRLIRALLSGGWQVTALVRPSSNVARLPAGAAILVDDGGMAGLLAGVQQAAPDLVFHLAARFQAEHAPDDVEPLLRDNILFPTRLLEAAVRGGCRRFVNTGTLWQHPEGEGSVPVNLYAAAKQAFADLLAYYAAAEGVAALTLCLGDTYGPDDPRGKLLCQLRAAAARDEVLAMSPGAQRLDLVHVADVVDACLVAAQRTLAPGFAGKEEWAVTSGRLASLKEVVTLFQRLNGGRPQVNWGARPYRPREVMDPVPGPPLPGWSPRVTLEEGLRDLLRTAASSPGRQAAGRRTP